MDWMVGLSDDELIKYAYKLHEPVDTILMGRKMTDVFISTWLDVMNKPDDPWYLFAKKMIETPKVVFTKTLNESKWINTDIATGDLIEEVNKIKSQNGGDIIVYGGASFDSSLIKEKLIDEFYFFINPVAIGNGMTIFNITLLILVIMPLRKSLLWCNLKGCCLQSLLETEHFSLILRKICSSCESNFSELFLVGIIAKEQFVRDSSTLFKVIKLVLNLFLGTPLY